MCHRRIAVASFTGPRRLKRERVPASVEFRGNFAPGLPEKYEKQFVVLLAHWKSDFLDH